MTVELTDIGDIPYEIIRPVLLKIENPKQLQNLEEACPQLYGPDEELWKAFIRRDIHKWEEKMIYPKNPKSWSKVYRKLQKEHEAEVAEDTARLKAAFSGIKQEKDRHQSRVMEGVPHIPKLDGMQFAHAAEYNRVKKPVKDTRPTTTVLKFNSGSKTKVLTGRGVMEKARREAMELNRFKKNSALSTPTHQLHNIATQVLRAPPGRIEDFKRAAIPQPIDPTIPKPAIFVPPKRIVTNVEKMRIEERERRLRAAKARATMSSATPSTTPLPHTKKEPVSDSNITTSKHASITPSTSKSPSDANKAHSPTLLAPRKRKPEHLSITPSIEAADSAHLTSPIQTPPISPRYNIPRFKSSSASPESSGGGVRVMKKKAPVSCFMPAKKRRVV
ncbi:MAG: hypothetical protein Q9222_001752 [Ikaeria aurantiellina]